jgi:hypothetical protein
MPTQNYAISRRRLTISGYTTVSVHFFGVFLLSRVIGTIIQHISSFVKAFSKKTIKGAAEPYCISFYHQNHMDFAVSFCFSLQILKSSSAASLVFETTPSFFGKQ